ncbi:MAG: hypothetical protein J6L96_00675 [Clostridia bacterium]|nr:hypothetical protein [Clostridia bacterium]MBP3875130.1 hypothetical protein [Lachnospiraceae bacterium]
MEGIEMCKYCKKISGFGWTKQEKFINTEEEFETLNRQRIWNTHNKNNSSYAIIHDYAGITPDYEGNTNGRLVVFLPEINENINISINYCPFCGKKLGDIADKYI